MEWIDPVAHAAFWSAATILFYAAAKRLHARLARWWTAPLLVAPALLIVLALALHESYRDYIRQTHWLVALLGPATVAFAVPVWENRGLIRRHWALLLLGAAAGSFTSIVSVWLLANALGLDEALRLSLAPRSISTPFAMTVSAEIGGVPDLTAVFVIVTGLLGAAMGDLVLGILPLRSGLARGALFGMGAHGVGVTKAIAVGSEEGSVAGVMMVLAGVANVLAAPLIACVIHAVSGG